MEDAKLRLAIDEKWPEYEKDGSGYFDREESKIFIEFLFAWKFDKREILD